MNEKDLEKATAIWQSMNELNGENKPFPADEIAGAMALLKEQMEAEDPEATVCRGHPKMWISGAYAPIREENKTR